MNQDLLNEINNLLSNLKLENFHKKDVVIEDLSDFIENIAIPIQSKNNIVKNVIDLFNCKNNYTLQESIFHFLGVASSQNILQDEIIDIMLKFMADPTPEFLQYAVDILADADLSLPNTNRFKELIIKCLHSKNTNVKKVIASILEYYQKNGIPLIEES